MHIYVYKAGGGRTSWEKEWFNSSNPYTTKTDFNREQIWPSPTNYRIKSTIANANPTVYHQSPIHSIGVKLSSDTNLISAAAATSLSTKAAAFLPTQAALNANLNNDYALSNEKLQAESNEICFISHSIQHIFF